MSRRRYATLRSFFAGTRLRQSELAEQVGVSSSAISLYAHGKRRPSGAIAIRLSKLTGVPLEALLDPKPEAKAS